MSIILELKNICKYYDEECILNDISLRCHAGQALAITGDSGGGKTTLLSILGLMQQATEGQIFLHGQEVGSLPSDRQAKLRSKYFGFVFQRSRLVSSLSVLENVLVPAWIVGCKESQERRAKDLLAYFNLEHRLQHKPQQLSLGQMRRVALARALLLQPPILLVDEPTNDLDPPLAALIADEILKTRQTGTAVVIVTHDRQLAERSDALYALCQGQLVDTRLNHAVCNNVA